MAFLTAAWIASWGRAIARAPEFELGAKSISLITLLGALSLHTRGGTGHDEADATRIDPSLRRMRLRYGGKCLLCGAELPKAYRRAKMQRSCRPCVDVMKPAENRSVDDV